MAAGHFMMTFEPLFYPALATIALGNGLFLPSLPSQINDLYRPDDHRRGWAYNVYYVGINIGGFLAPLVCGTLGEFYGWHWGFGAAGVGMLIGLAIYLMGRPTLPKDPLRNAGAAEPRPPLTREGWLRIGVLIALLPVLAVAMVYNQQGFNAYLVWAEQNFQLVFF